MKTFFCFLGLWLFFSLACFSIWGVSTVGDVEFENIFFHMFMPLQGAHTDWAQDLWKPLIGMLITGIIAFVVCYVFKIKIILLTLFFLIVFDCWYVNKHFKACDFLKSQFESSNFIEQYYVMPHYPNIVFPDKKKNLIIVMVESLETSYQDKENGGLLDDNYIPELTKLAKENISFSSSDKIEGAFVAPETGWTIAATVAQTAGIPLKLYGSLETNNKKRKIDNSMGKYKYFLPGAITLGDILSHNGYKNYFILGTDAQFAGKSTYLKQHGDYIIYDKNNIEGGTHKRYYQDQDLFSFIKQQLPQISKQQPFSLLIQTINTHFAKKDVFQDTSKIVDSFLQWLKKQDFYQNTVIIVVGDHCNMKHTDFNNIEKTDFRYMGNMRRKIYNLFINSLVKPVSEKNRKFSTFDMFPTILASLGVQIKDDKLGLGTNLFSNKKTLFEIYEPEYVFTELKKKSHWYNKRLLYKDFFIWGNR